MHDTLYLKTIYDGCQGLRHGSKLYWLSDCSGIILSDPWISYYSLYINQRHRYRGSGTSKPDAVILLGWLAADFSHNIFWTRIKKHVGKWININGSILVRDSFSSEEPGLAQQLLLSFRRGGDNKQTRPSSKKLR